MKDEEKFVYRRRLSGKLLIASLLILSGIVLLARNLGWITNEVFDVIMSWQTLLVVLGVYPSYKTLCMRQKKTICANMQYLTQTVLYLLEHTRTLFKQRLIQA